MVEIRWLSTLLLTLGDMYHVMNVLVVMVVRRVIISHGCLKQDRLGRSDLRCVCTKSRAKTCVVTPPPPFSTTITPLMQPRIRQCKVFLSRSWFIFHFLPCVTGKD